MSLSSIEIRHLRTFLAIAESANFTRAAVRLGLSQPSVSQQVKELEAALGVGLFHRAGQKIRLTQAGEAFVDRASMAVRRFQEALAPAISADGGLAGHLDVGVIPALTMSWASQLLAEIACDAPGITVRLHELPAHRIETGLEAGHLDLGLALLSNASPALQYETLRTDHLVLVLRASDPRWRSGPVALDALAEEPLALLPEAFPMRQHLDELFRAHGLRPPIRFEIDRIEALLATVALSGIPTFLPGLVLERPSGAIPPLRAVEVSGPVAPMSFGLVWSRSRMEAPAARYFRELAGRLLRA